jgi:glycosyltransferase involved in cell wall biosynthesis
MKSENSSNELRGRDIVCFPQDWTGDPLSKTHIMRILARENRVLWVNSIGLRAPSVSKADLSRSFEKLAKAVKPLEEVEPNLFVMNPLTIPAYGSPLMKAFNSRSLRWQIKRAMKKLGFKTPVNYTFLPSAALLAKRLGEDFLIYHCVDEYAAFTDIPSEPILRLEEELLKKSDLVIVSAEKLYETKKEFNANTFLIRHGTDWRHFRRALDTETKIPAEIADLPRPIIGFHGLLADWIDFELLRKTAEHFENGSIVLIGKVTADAENKARILKDVPNVHFLGRKPYADLPAYCKAFDAALNPFEINELTLAANPLKVREYLAAGVPVVSTDIPEVRVLDDCLIGENHADFIRQIEIALKNAKPREAISDRVRHESWDAKVDELRGIMATRRRRDAVTR